MPRRVHSWGEPGRPGGTRGDGIESLLALFEAAIDSYEALDVLVHIYRTAPAVIAADAVAQALAFAPDVVTRVLTQLAEQGVLSMSDAGWHYDPAGDWGGTIELVAELYDWDRGQLLTFMTYVAFDSCVRQASALHEAERKRSSSS